MDEYVLPQHKGLNQIQYKSLDDQVKDASAADSIRRWWWEYLRLSKDYWFLCQTCAEGEPETYDETLKQIFKDFGNVHEGTFEDWWRKTGTTLFAEREKLPHVEQITSAESAVSENRAGKILVEIPLQLTRETVLKQIGRILDLYSDQRPIHRYKTSTSKYPIEPVLSRINVIRQAHEVYCLHRELVDKPKALARLGAGRELSEHDNKANLFRIGKIYGLSPSNASLTGYPDEIAKKTKNMRSEVSRVIGRAETLLSYVEAGRFAVINEDPLTPKPRFSSKQDAAFAKMEEQWWALDLHSTLSENKIEAARALHYSGS